MKREYFSTTRNGFYGAYYENYQYCDRGIILMLGDKIDNLMVKIGARWLQKNGCNVMAMASDTKDYAYHDYPIECFEKAIDILKSKGNTKFGIIGASTTAMIALTAASFIPDITLTIALSPSDFIMEGFYRDGLDGARERPGNNESTLTYKGKRLPYLPFAYRHPEYWKKLQEEAKRRGDMAAARDMFDLSEQICPLTEDTVKCTLTIPVTVSSPLRYITAGTKKNTQTYGALIAEPKSWSTASRHRQNGKSPDAPNALQCGLAAFLPKTSPITGNIWQTVSDCLMKRKLTPSAKNILQFLIKSRIQSMSARGAERASHTERFVLPGRKRTAAAGADRSGTTLPDCRKNLNNQI